MSSLVLRRPYCICSTAQWGKQGPCRKAFCSRHHEYLNNSAPSALRHGVWTSQHAGHRLGALRILKTHRIRTCISKRLCSNLYAHLTLRSTLGATGSQRCLRIGIIWMVKNTNKQKTTKNHHHHLGLILQILI